jgi:hypothetical protein
MKAARAEASAEKALRVRDKKAGRRRTSKTSPV